MLELASRTTAVTDAAIDRAGRGIASTVHIAFRTDGLPGSGTARDPFDGSTAEKFDAVMRAAMVDAGHVTILIGEGTFETYGEQHSAASYDPNGDRGWSIKQGARSIRGAGMGRTTLRLKAWPQFGWGASQTGWHIVFGANYGGFCRGFLLEDITLDCNYPNLTGVPTSALVGGSLVYLDGPGTYSRVEAKNFKSTEGGPENFVLFFGQQRNRAAFWPESEKPDQSLLLEAVGCHVHTGYSGNLAQRSYNEGIALFNSNAPCRFIGNRVHDLAGGSSCIQFIGNGILVEGNYFLAGGGGQGGLYLDTGNFDNVVVRNNVFRHEWKGVDGYGYGHVTVCGLSLNLADFGAIYFKTTDEDGSYNGEYVDLLYRPEAQGENYVLRCYMVSSGHTPSPPSAPVYGGTTGGLLAVSYSPGATRNQLRDAFIAALNSYYDATIVPGITAPAWVASTAYVAGGRAKNGGSLYYATSDHTSGSSFATDLAAGKWVRINPAANIYEGYQGGVGVSSRDGFVATRQQPYASYVSDTDLLEHHTGSRANNWIIDNNIFEIERKTLPNTGGVYQVALATGNVRSWKRNWRITNNIFKWHGTEVEGSHNQEMSVGSVAEGLLIAFNVLEYGMINIEDYHGASAPFGSEVLFGNRTGTGAQAVGGGPGGAGYRDHLPGVTSLESLSVGGNQVVGARQPAIADATDAASAITQLNLLLTAARTHGLIDT